MNVKGWVCLVAYFAIACWDVWLLRSRDHEWLFATSLAALVGLSMVLGWVLIEAFNGMQRRRRRAVR